MREICTSGSVGAPGEQSPRATRPDSNEVLLLHARFTFPNVPESACVPGIPFTAKGRERLPTFQPPDERNYHVRQNDGPHYDKQKEKASKPW